MKKFTLLAALLLLAGCHRKKDDPAPSGPQLPAETQTGAGTMGCYVNGELWLSDSPLNPAMGSGVQVRAGGVHLFLLAYRTVLNNKTAIRFAMDQGFRGVGTYRLIPPTNNTDAYFSTDRNYRNYFADSSSDNQLTITRFDTVQRILSGRFQFRGVWQPPASSTQLPDTIRITDGRFDFRLQ